MARNLELKARAQDFSYQRKLAEELACEKPKLLRQIDVFFNVPEGRLKLRELSPSYGELIYYRRPDQLEKKVSNYSIVRSDHPKMLASILSDAYGVCGTVRKERWLYMVEQTRIHFDDVDSLGYFIELEVVMKEGQTVEEAERVSEFLKRKLGIRDEDLVSCAYLDLINGQNALVKPSNC
jgi:predicted adenylyl cyclase CyaB